MNYGILQIRTKKLETDDIHRAGVAIFFAGKRRCQKSTWEEFPGKDAKMET